MFQHQTSSNEPLNLSLGKIVCVGRNYADHVKELGNEIPKAPLLFMKPATAAVELEKPFSTPQDQGEVHHEVEIAVLISKTACNISEEDSWDHVSHLGVALDLTLRDVQSKLKEKGQPWEMAKAFDGSCPLSTWTPLENISDRNNIAIRLERNGEARQDGNSNMMLTSIPKLIAYISQYFTLEAGDVVITGTPAGVGPLNSGDKLKVTLDDQFTFETHVI